MGLLMTPADDLPLRRGRHSGFCQTETRMVYGRAAIETCDLDRPKNFDWNFIMNLFRFSLITGILLSVLSAGSASAQTSRRSRAAPTAIGLQIKTDGIYQLTYGYLASHHFNPASMNIHKLGIADDGRSIAEFIHHAGSGSDFHPGDYVEFYAHPLNNTYSDTNVYVVTDNGSNVRYVQNVQATAPNSPASVASNAYTDEQRTQFMPVQPALPAYTIGTSWPSTGDPHWKETDLVTFTSQPSASTQVSFSLANPNPTGACSISVPAFGLADTASTATPSFEMGLTMGADHLTNPASGATSFTWQSTNATSATYTAATTFPCSDLGQGAGATVADSLTFSSAIQPSVQVSEVTPNYFTIGYEENLCAVGDQLRWQEGAHGSYAISGFGNSSISVWRVSGSTAQRFTGLTSGGGAGGCAGGGDSASFTDPSPGEATFFATSAPLTPAGAHALDLSSITTGSHKSAEYLIVSSPDFSKLITPLAKYHRQQGLTVKVVTTAAVYDQYRSKFGHFTRSHGRYAHAGDGLVDPRAIRAYITYAVEHLGTHYVLIAGGDTEDYHNYLACSEANPCAAAQNPLNKSIVPSLYVDSIYFGPTPSDNLYAVSLQSKTDAPDVAIGRLPAVNATDLKTEINKTIKWHKLLRHYARTATFAAGFGQAVDYGAGACPDPQFQTSSDTMISYLPAGWTVNKAYEDGKRADDAANRQRFLQLFNRGQEIVNYVGHGNVFEWSCAHMFQASDVAGLTNVDRPSAVFQWGCQATDINNAEASNIDALLLRATDGHGRPTGATIAVGSAGLDLAYPQAVLAGGTTQTGPHGHHFFYGYLRKGETVGMALKNAKDDVVSLFGGSPDYADVVNSYNILGDPALTIPLR